MAGRSAAQIYERTQEVIDLFLSMDVFTEDYVWESLFDAEVLDVIVEYEDRIPEEKLEECDRVLEEAEAQLEELERRDCAGRWVGHDRWFF